VISGASAPWFEDKQLDSVRLVSYTITTEKLLRDARFFSYLAHAML